MFTAGEHCGECEERAGLLRNRACVKFSLKSTLEISEKEKNSFLTVSQFFLP